MYISIICRLAIRKPLRTPIVRLENYWDVRKTGGYGEAHPHTLSDCVSLTGFELSGPVFRRDNDRHAAAKVQGAVRHGLGESVGAVGAVLPAGVP